MADGLLYLNKDDLTWTDLLGFSYGCRDVILKTIYTYIQLVMPLREEWKSRPIRVDLQAVIRIEVWRVFKTELVIILLRAVWIHIVLLWSGFSEIGEGIKLRITVNHQCIKATSKKLLGVWRSYLLLVVVVTSLCFLSKIGLCYLSTA